MDKKELQLYKINQVEKKLDSICEIKGFNFAGPQKFLKIFMNPLTDPSRLLVQWQTGTGKTFAVVVLAEIYIKMLLAYEFTPKIIIIGFTKTVIQDQMLERPELGYISKAEFEHLDKLRIAARSTGKIDVSRNLNAFYGSLRRRITDSSRGGYYSFYGYKEFSNKLFIPIQENFNEDEFYSKLNIDELKKAIEDKKIKINDTFIESIGKETMIFADEIHNVYNIRERNSYGTAIQYILDLKKSGYTPPKAVFLSATPVSGDVREVVDLLNLLIPQKHKSFVDSDFLDEDGWLLPGADKEIGILTRGYVSFLLDRDIEAYPTRLFIGSSIKNIPYLKFIKCELTPDQQAAVDSEGGEIRRNDIYVLFDLIFPGGLYSLKDQSKIAKITNYDFLEIGNIKKYSEKYFTFLQSFKNNFSDGKVIIYHSHIHMSGVFLIEKMLRVNGLISINDSVSDKTICAFCGKEMLGHDNKEHTFSPARFFSIHYELDKNTIKRNIANFNSFSNVDGRLIKVLIGSRMIVEGYDFKAIRNLYILSVPNDISTLIQIFGRAVRRGSHLTLPSEKRDVKIHIMSNKYEIEIFKDKMKRYIEIQKVDREIRRNAIDNCNNYIPQLMTESTIDSLPFEFSENCAIKKSSSSFYAFNYGNELKEFIKMAILSLFSHTNYWKFEDILYALRNGLVKKFDANVDFIDENIVSSALIDLISRSITTKIKYFPPYFISSSDNKSDIISFDIVTYLQKDIFEKTFITNLSKFDFINNKYHILLMYKSNFFIELCKRIIKDDIILDNQFIDMFIHFGILHRYIDLDSELKKIINIAPETRRKNKIIAYSTDKSTYVYDKTKTWKSFRIGFFPIIKNPDNGDIVGFVEDQKFKIRPSKKEMEIIEDARTIESGSVCESNKKQILEQILFKLGVEFDSDEDSTKKICMMIFNALLEREMVHQDEKTWFEFILYE